ncbi:hypothetical protein VKT23_019981 [Stygiomarasmius scandens]|uniref:Uncharacterized protein n=1 Tax=Marasmiellus scandens TaxID=2682957 RepID=A0ABR1IKD4_9AGAR
MGLNERRVHFLASSICNGIRDTIHALLRKSRPPESFMSREDFQSFFESYRQWGAELDIEHNPRHPDWVKRVMYALDLTFRLHSSHFKKIGEDELSRPSWLPSPAFSNTKLFPVAKLYGFLIPDEEELAELAPPPPDDTELLVESLMADETPPPPSSLLASATRQSDSAQLPPKKRAKIEKTTPSTTTSQPSKVQPTRKSKVDMVSKLHGQRTSTPSSSISTRHTQSAPVKKRPQMASVSVPTGSKRKAVDSEYDSDFNDDPDISVTSNGEDEKDEQSDFEEDEEPNLVKKSKASKGKAKATTKTTARKAPAKTNAAKEIADAERELQIIPPMKKGDLATMSIQNALLVRPLNAVCVKKMSSQVTRSQIVRVQHDPAKVPQGFIFSNTVGAAFKAEDVLNTSRSLAAFTRAQACANCHNGGLTKACVPGPSGDTCVHCTSFKENCTNSATFERLEFGAIGWAPFVTRSAPVIKQQMDRVQANVNTFRASLQAFHNRLHDEQVALAYLYDQVKAEHDQLVQMMADPARVIWQLQHQSPEFEFTEENMSTLASVCGWEYVPTREHAQRLADKWAQKFPSGRPQTLNIPIPNTGTSSLIDEPEPAIEGHDENDDKVPDELMYVDEPDPTVEAAASTSSGGGPTSPVSHHGPHASGRPSTTALLVQSVLAGSSGSSTAGADGTPRVEKGTEKATEVSVASSPQVLVPDSE